MKIIIPGGAGFVGRNLLRVMKSRKFNMAAITVIDKDQKNLDYVKRYGIKAIYADLAEHGKWEDEFKDKDFMVYLAAQISSSNPDDFKRNNVMATRNVIDAIKKSSNRRIKIFNFSSAAVLSVRKDDYAKTKKESEEIVTRSGLRVFTVRPSLMFGLTDTKNIGYLINFARKFPLFPIPGKGDYPRQPIYIDDVCMLIMGILKRFPKKNMIVSVNGKDTLLYKDMIKTVLEEMGGFKMMIHLPVPIFKMLMQGYQGIIGKRQFTPDQVDSLTSHDVFPDYPWWDVFRIKPTTFRQGVRKMIAEMRANRSR